MNAIPGHLLPLAEPDSPERIAIEAALGPRSYRAFLRMAWRYIDPAPLSWNWHYDLLCEEMQAVARREVRELVLCVPPRTGKSIAVGVGFAAWVWTWHPAAKFITASNEMTLATRDAVKTRRLVESDWYQKRWGPGSPHLPPGHPGVALQGDQNNKTYYETTAGGHRFCATPGRMVTGHGADYILCLPGDQRILTERGWLPIGQVVREKTDATVLSYNHETGQAEFRRILAFERHPPRELVEIETSDGQTLRCTVDHPVWVVGKGYIPAGEVQIDDEVLTCPVASTA